MSLLLNTGAMHYRENANEEWKPLVIKADVDIESLADPYSPLSTYSVGEYCTHDGKVYRCISTISTAEAWNSSHWQETTIGQELESINYVRPNLLDNWYFAGNGSQNGNFPINQRGQGYYTNAGVTIDRWFKATDGAINSITKEYGLLVTPNTVLYQKLSTDTKDALDGKTCTLTLLTNDGKIRSGTFVYKSAPSSTITILNVAGVVKFECGIDGNIYITWLSSFNTGYFAIKLELGDTQTLAHQEGNTWVLNEIPDYAEQLAKCQRYYIICGGFFPGYGYDASTFMASISLPVTMVKAPTVSASGTGYFIQDSGHSIASVSNTSVLFDNGVRISGSATVNANKMGFVSGLTITLSAEL